MAATVVPRAGTARRWHTAARVSRTAALVVAVLLAFAGAMVSSAMVTLVWAPVVGAVAAVAAAVVNPDHPATAEARRTTCFVGSTAALVVPATSGLGLLGNSAVVVVIALLVLGAFWLVATVAEAPETTEGSAARRDLANLRRVIGELSVEGLLREWQMAAGRLRDDVSPEARLIATEIRALIVDELTRRDPAGTEHWLHTGEGDPRRYVPGGPAAPS